MSPAPDAPPGSGPDSHMIGLRVSALWFLNVPAHSAAQVIAIGDRLAADQERILSPGHPDTLASRDSLANAYRVAGRTDEALALHEQVLAARERVLGPDHPGAGRRGRMDAREQVRAGGTDRAAGIQARSRPAERRPGGRAYPARR